MTTYEDFCRYLDWNIERTLLQQGGREALKMHRDIEKLNKVKVEILTHFECNNCGWCCRRFSVQLLQQDFKQLMKVLNIGKKEFYDKYMDKTALIPNYLIRPCPFYREETKDTKTKDGSCTVSHCSIYENRPLICKMFPFNDMGFTIGKCKIGHELIVLMKDIGIEIVMPGEENKEELIIKSGLQSIRDNARSLLPENQENDPCSSMSITNQITHDLLKELRRRKSQGKDINLKVK